MSIRRRRLIRVGAIGGSATAQIRNLLFSEGQQGVLYYPKPIVDGDQVLWQMADGTVVVDTHDDPTGLILDLHEGLTLGPELVTNGTFDTDLSGWTAGDAESLLTHESDRMRVTNGDAGAAYAIQTVALVVGVTYKISMDVETSRSFRGRLIVGGFDTGNALETGQESFIFRAENTNDFALTMGNGTQVGDWIEFDNVSIRELPGNHATQSTSAFKMLYQTDGTLHWLASDGVDDRIKATYQSAVTQPCTLSVAIDKQDVGSDTVIVTGLGSADRHQLSINASGNLVAIAGGTTLDSGAGLANGKHIVTAVLDGASSSIRVDGVEVATGDLGTATAGGMTISSLWDGTLPITQDFYGGIHVEGIGNVSDIENYLNDLIGGGVL